MKIIICLFTTISLSFLPFNCFSNGGPIDLGYLRKTGNIRLLRNADVSLLKENLFLKVVGDYTEIEVEYHLKNNGKEQKIQYGFPVDAYQWEWCHCMGFPPFSKENDVVKYFKITSNEKELNVSHWVIDYEYSAKSINLDLYPDYDSYGIMRKWYATTIDFRQGETQIIKVIYKTKNTLKDKLAGMRFVPQFTSRHFTYHLTPSSNWGNGVVHDFNLKIDVTDIAQVGAKFTIKGIEGLSNENHIFSYHAKDYDLKKSDRIDIHYQYNHFKLSEFIRKREVKNIVKSIKSSSNNETVHHLIDKSPKTTWTGRQGDWVEIELVDKPKKYQTLILRGVLALNGDYSNKENYEKSGKVKEVIITANDTIIYYDEIPKAFEKDRLVYVKESYFKDLSDSTMNGLASIIIDNVSIGFTEDYIHKIRIQFLKATNQANKEFTLSELYFLFYKRE